jgi:hypothetical protein
MDQPSNAAADEPLSDAAPKGRDQVYLPCPAGRRRARRLYLGCPRPLAWRMSASRSKASARRAQRQLTRRCSLAPEKVPVPPQAR